MPLCTQANLADPAANGLMGALGGQFGMFILFRFVLMRRGRSSPVSSRNR